MSQLTLMIPTQISFPTLLQKLVMADQHIATLVTIVQLLVGVKVVINDEFRTATDILRYATNGVSSIAATVLHLRSTQLR